MYTHTCTDMYMYICINIGMIYTYIIHTYIYIYMHIQFLYVSNMYLYSRLNALVAPIVAAHAVGNYYLAEYTYKYIYLYIKIYMYITMYMSACVYGIYTYTYVFRNTPFAPIVAANEIGNEYLAVCAVSEHLHTHTDTHTHKHTHTHIHIHTHTHARTHTHTHTHKWLIYTISDSCVYVATIRIDITHAHLNACGYIRKRALYFRQRPLYLRKWLIYTRNNSFLYVATYSHWHYSCICECICVHPQKIFLFPQKTLSSPQETHFGEKQHILIWRDIFLLTLLMYIWMYLDTSAKEPCESAKKALYFCKRALYLCKWLIYTRNDSFLYAVTYTCYSCIAHPNAFRYIRKRALDFRKEPLISTNDSWIRVTAHSYMTWHSPIARTHAFHIRMHLDTSAKEPFDSAKEPFDSAKEPFDSTKEPLISAKELFISAKEPRIYQNECTSKKSPAYLQKRPKPPKIQKRLKPPKTPQTSKWEP